MYKVIGFKKVDYVSKKDGQPRKGYEIYVEETTPGERVEGIEVHEFYLNAYNSAYVPRLGDTVKPSYNRYGRVDDFIVIAHE